MENTMLRLASITSALLMLTTAAYAADLTVTVNGVKNSSGSVAAAIFNAEDNFPRGAPMGGFRMKASGGPVTFTFRNLPSGKYASTSFHDENDNGKLDADPTGLPTEGYGVSNDAREVLAPPQWAKASFDLTDQGKSITINLSY